MPSYEHRAFVGDENRRFELLQETVSLLVESIEVLHSI